MQKKQEEVDKAAPVVTLAQLAELKAKLAAAGREPVLPIGTVSVCPTCGGRMLTTNDLDRTVASPGLIFVVTRLPGARCTSCGATELDAAGVTILETSAPRAVWADFETAVTHASGATLGTYFKMDLARVLRLSGAERLSWRVIDRDRALVEVRRESTQPHGYAGRRRDESREAATHPVARRERRRRVSPES